MQTYEKYEISFVVFVVFWPVAKSLLDIKCSLQVEHWTRDKKSHVCLMSLKIWTQVFKIVFLKVVFAKTFRHSSVTVDIRTSMPISLDDETCR